MPTPNVMLDGRLQFAREEDVDLFVKTLDQFERGEIDADTWRAFRLVNGTYGQRQDGDWSMLRVKIPQGIVNAEQLEVLADTALRWSRGFLHITTRENVQMHYVRLHDAEHAMRALAEHGMTTREACGNSIRNVTASPSAGVAADEVFDVVPYAEAFTRYFLRHPLSASLPRKFKVAFEGGGQDHVFANLNDIGFVATHTADGRRAFRVTLAGGTATLCTSGFLRDEALPAGEILALAEAIVRVFHVHGDRKNRLRNRMKFLVKQLGFIRFQTLVDEALAMVRQEGAPKLPFDPESPPETHHAPTNRAPRPTPGELSSMIGSDPMKGPGKLPNFVRLTDPPLKARFLRGNVRPQRQAGYSLVTITLPLGDVSSGRMRALAALSRTYSDGTLRLTIAQNLMLRWVPNDQVNALYEDLERIGLGRPDGGTLGDISSCPGAETCKLAVTQSRGVASLLNDFIDTRRDLVERAEDLVVKVSGCPNGCGLHHAAGIGLQGGLRKIGGRPVPHYFLYVGGEPQGAKAKFARLAGKIPARRVPQAFERLVELYEAQRNTSESITTFLSRVELSNVRKALADIFELREEDATAEDFVDLGDTETFVGDTQEGECAA